MLNIYKISYDYTDCDYADEVGWHEVGVGYGNTWQDAIKNWLWDTSYKVISETPSEDGRSGIMEIHQTPPPEVFGWNQVQATFIDPDLTAHT